MPITFSLLSGCLGTFPRAVTVRAIASLLRPSQLSLAGIPVPLHLGHCPLMGRTPGLPRRAFTNLSAHFPVLHMPTTHLRRLTSSHFNTHTPPATAMDSPICAGRAVSDAFFMLLLAIIRAFHVVSTSITSTRLSPCPSGGSPPSRIFEAVVAGKVGHPAVAALRDVRRHYLAFGDQLSPV